MTKHLYILLTTLLITIPTLHSCKGDKSDNTEEHYEEREAPATEEVDDTAASSITYIKEEDYIFPTSGKSAEDFVPPNSIYEIIDKAQGDLNGDNLDDIVLLLKHKYDVEGSSPVLILFKNTDSTYILKEMSRVAKPSSFTNYYVLHEVPGDFSINNKELKISTYLAPRGLINTKFIYIDNRFALSYVESSSSGSGAVSTTTYEPLIGKYTLWNGWYDETTEEEKESTETRIEKPKRYLIDDPNLPFY